MNEETLFASRSMKDFKKISAIVIAIFFGGVGVITTVIWLNDDSIIKDNGILIFGWLPLVVIEIISAYVFSYLVKKAEGYSLVITSQRVIIKYPEKKMEIPLQEINVVDWSSFFSYIFYTETVHYKAKWIWGAGGRELHKYVMKWKEIYQKQH